MLVIGLVVRLLGIDRIQYADDGSIPYGQLLAMCAVMGFTGAIISLLLSKFIAKTTTGARVISQPASAQEQWLVSTVERLARESGIGMPDVAIYNSRDVNAFATGAFKNHALVAVSSGLLDTMQKDEVEAVLAHEIGHVANGDMVTLTLIQGVLNTFVYFFAHIIGMLVDSAMNRSEDGERRRSGGPGSYLVYMVAQLVLGLLASMIVAWFSRRREYRADAASAKLRGSQAMIRALQTLQRIHEPAQMPKQLAAFGIRPAGGVLSLFRTHPPLEERIAALRGI